MFLAMIVIHVMQLTIRRDVLKGSTVIALQGILDHYAMLAIIRVVFVSNGSKKCGTCKSPEVSFLLFLMLFMVNMLYTVYFIRNTRYLINAVIKHEDEVSQLRRSTYFGLLNNYGQIATLIFSFNFISSNEVSDLAMAFGFANPVSTLNLSMECMYEFFGLDTANFYYYTIILTVILPNTRVDNYRDKNDQMESKTQ